MLRKFQVFISATFKDLVEERREVFFAVMTARHIPVGMELFTATTDRGWATIKRVIDTTDYYVVIVGGRYGETGPDGMSWTEKEYRYAVEQKIPVLAFIRRDAKVTLDRMDEDPKLTKKLTAFKKLLRDTHLCVDWDDKEDLARKVSDGLRNHIQDDEAEGSSRPGWLRGGADTLATATELARLSQENRELRAKVEALAQEPVALEIRPYGAEIEDPTADPIVVTRPRLAFQKTPRGQFDFALLTRPSDDRIVEWVDEVNRHVLVRLLVANVGSRRATDVELRLYVHPADEVALSLDEPTMVTVPERIPNPAWNAHVDSRREDGDGMRVVIRIKHIAPGTEVEVDDLYVILPKSSTAFTIEAAAIDGDGDRTERALNFELHLSDAPRVLTRDDFPA